jgi:protein-disulfide isomerase
MEPNKSFFDLLPPKMAFTAGIVLAILALGTLGFVLLSGCLLSGKCGNAIADSSARNQLAINNQAAAVPDTAPLPDEEYVGPIAAVTDQDWIRGDKNAAVTIVEYSDFECPFCQRFHPTMQQIANEYQGKVRWVYRHFPLSFHPSAEPAAEAAECAGEQGKFWEFADNLFENQSRLGDAYYKQLAGELKLNMKTFEDCLASDRTLAKIQSQYQGGATAGVNGTPGSFIIGKDGSVQPVRGALPYESVKAMIDAVL